MITEVKYFHEKTTQDFETYNKLWDENRERIVYIEPDLPNKQQINGIINNFNNNNKDILAVRFPTLNEIKRNKIIDDILLGKGLRYESDKVWYPREIWIYNPFG
jgi:hypothetical protein